MPHNLTMDAGHWPRAAFAVMLMLSPAGNIALHQQRQVTGPATDAADPVPDETRPAPAPNGPRAPGDAAPPDVIAPPRVGDPDINKTPPPAENFPTPVLRPSQTPHGDRPTTPK